MGRISVTVTFPTERRQEANEFSNASSNSLLAPTEVS